MVEGFTDKKGKFHPTESTKGISSSSVDSNTQVTSMKNSEQEPKSLQTEQRFKHIPIFKFNEASPELQEKILENWRNKYSATDDNWADYEVLDTDIFSNSIPTGYNVTGSGDFIMFDNLTVIDEEKFRKKLGISKSIWDIIEYVITDDVNGTTIEFHDPNATWDDELTEPNQNHENISRSDADEIRNGKEKFDQIIKEGRAVLKSSYEREFDDTFIKETIEANDYDFDEDGDITTV